MSTTLIRRAATVDIDGDAFTVRTGSTCKLDLRAVPYATARVELPLLDDEVLSWLDPRGSGVRVPVSAEINGGTPRVFDLGLRSRVVDHKAKTVTLDLASDEALLQDYTALSEDTGAFALAASVRDVCDYVLGKVIPGASVEAGASDADATPFWEVINLMPNPAARAVVGNWIAGGSNGTLSREAGHAAGSITTDDPTVTTAFLTSWAGNSGLGSGGAVSQTAGVVPYAPVQPGELYTVYVRVHATVAKNVQLLGQIFGADGAVLNGGAPIATAALAAGTWTWVEGTIRVPANASRVGPFLYAGAGVQWASGNAMRTSCWMIHKGSYPARVPYFDGATPPSAEYTYVASGAAHASATTRTPVGDERRPELLIWPAGVTAWEFLTPILTAAGLVLWCDEQRRWFLDTPENRSLPAQVNVSATNARDGQDALSRDDDEAYVSGVVARFKWRDDDGIEQQQVDAAGTPEKVLVVDLDRPYPGPGTAAAILARRQGTGRRQDVTTVTIMTTTPGMAVQISLPGAPDTLGRVAAVEFDLHEGFMTLDASGLVDVTPGDWLAEDADLDWADVDPALDWEDA